MSYKTDLYFILPLHPNGISVDWGMIHISASEVPGSEVDIQVLVHFRAGAKDYSTYFVYDLDHKCLIGDPFIADRVSGSLRECGNIKLNDIVNIDSVNAEIERRIGETIRPMIQ